MRKTRRWRRRLAVASAVTVALPALAVAIAVLARPYDPARLRPAEGASLVLTDRNGAVLRELPLAGGGRARWVTLDRVPPALVAATLAGEDHRFREHHGVDGWAVLRAAALALRHGHVVSGASTITMQLARRVEPHPRTLGGKIGEMVDALRIERAVSKDVILEQYLNRACYGRGACGVEEAARRYFDKGAASLSAGEATLLAVLPRAPRRYDPLDALPEALERRAHVLALMQERGWLDEGERRAIEREPLLLHLPDDDAPAAPAAPAPAAAHFTDWVLAHLPAEARARGGSLRTTLDLDLQRRLEAAARTWEGAAGDGGALQAGLVVLDPADGSVRAMVGSVDHAGAEGQVNIVTARRHPGSALKPFVYALALEQGETPASLARDLPGAVPEYRPRRLMHAHGVASFRDALGGSYNLAAIDVLDRVGVAALLGRLREAGLGPLGGTSTEYGLDLALGAPRVRLLDLAAASAFLVRGGTVTRPRFLADEPPAPAARVFSPDAAWLVMDMLADANARRSTFGADLPLDLPFRVAAKTGTSSGFADTVAVAATREAVVAAWAGAFDGSGTKGRLAMWSAAPLVRAALLAVADLDGAPLTLPPPPEGIVTASVCRLTGQLAGPRCPAHREHFARGSEPRAVCAAH
jgi:penicillin-binding protein 1C